MMRTTMQTLTYQEAARQLLVQGFAELAEGDSRQASEKGWGAAAQMIKAVASNRGWKHDSHAALYRVVGNLVTETRDDGIRKRFTTANALHQNFYENWGDADYVSGGLADVKDLLDKLEPLLEQARAGKQRDG
ncbi:MAG: PaREP1 family protein [bacterium]|nr:PaREP1 family protein [bacterium]